MNSYDVTVIGGGPAGLAAAVKANKLGARVFLIEREEKLGGILKQCIHDGFGLVYFQEKLTGPEYAHRFIDTFNDAHIEHKTSTFVTSITKEDSSFIITMVSSIGVEKISSKTLILATGCRERTSKQIAIHGTRPAGVLTAGCAQNFVNLLGQMPTKKCVILGSGDIGLIMARRLTLEGAEVLGVYEIKSSPSGLSRNIQQCLHDYTIPLYLSHTVTKVFGSDRVEGVEIARVDDTLEPIVGSEFVVECDALILSVGLIPENELAENLGICLEKSTQGPKCDASFMTSMDGVFTAGNATHVNDLVDYVSESAEIAAEHAANYTSNMRSLVAIQQNENVLYVVPTMLDTNSNNSNTIVYFRSKTNIRKCKTIIKIDDTIVFEKKYAVLNPPEMERIKVDFSSANKNSKIKISIVKDE